MRTCVLALALLAPASIALAADAPVFTATTPLSADDPLVRDWQEHKQPGVVRIYPIVLQMPDVNLKAKTLTVVFEGKQHRFVMLDAPIDPSMDCWSGYEGSLTTSLGLCRGKPRHFWERPEPFSGGFHLAGRRFDIDAYGKQAVLVEIDMDLVKRAADDGSIQKYLRNP